MSSKSAFGATAVLASLLLTNIGSAEDAPSLRKGSWPIRNGHNYQPTQRELRDLHREDVTSEEARKIDRLYDELMTNSEKIRKRYPAPKP
jgi:hypothetical protein